MSFKVESAKFNSNQAMALIAKNKKTNFKTNIAFLQSHNGLRAGKTHLFIAPTGAGKTTFIRTLIHDITTHNPDKTVFCLFSEESVEDVKMQLSYGVKPEQLDNVEIISEIDNDDEGNAADFGGWLEEYLSITKPDVVVFDNLTTSKLYRGKNPSQQANISSRLKAMAKKHNFALFIIAHTGGKISEGNQRLLDENDIKGAKDITTLAEFLYILQPVYVGDDLYQFIRIRKHRGQELMASLYMLNYSKELRIFHKDMQIEFEKFKTIFGMRNKL